MEFGTAELDKRELAVAAVAAVGFLTAGVGNRLGAQVLARRTGCAGSRPAAGVPICWPCCATLLAAPRATAPTDRATGRRPAADLADGLDALHRIADRRGLVVVVSDFLDGLPDDPAGRRPGSGRCAGWPPGTRCWRSR